jgi:hypothetical protein
MKYPKRRRRRRRKKKKKKKPGGDCEQGHGEGLNGCGLVYRPCWSTSVPNGI